MYKQIVKKFSLVLGVLAVAVTGYLGAYSKEAGFTVGKLAQAQQWAYCVGMCTGYVTPEGYCERVAYCVDTQGNMHGPWTGHHNECCY